MAAIKKVSTKKKKAKSNPTTRRRLVYLRRRRNPTPKELEQMQVREDRQEEAALTLLAFMRDQTETSENRIEAAKILIGYW